MSTELRVGAVLLAVSTAMPVIAATLHGGKPPIVAGVIDLLLALCYFIACARLAVRYRREVVDADRLLAWRCAQYVYGAIPILLAAFSLLGQRIRWDVLTIGLAWRGWILLYTLPFIGAAVRLSSSISRVDFHD